MLNAPVDSPRSRSGRPSVPGRHTGGSQSLGKQPATILAVDDEPDALDFLHALLAPEGFDFMKAASGAQATALVTQRQPDLVIVDVMMPGMNGLEFCDLLRSDAALRHIPLILYSGYPMQEHSNSGLYDAAFLKPAEPDELVRVVRSLLPA